MLKSFSPEHLVQVAERSGFFQCQHCGLIWFGGPDVEQCPDGPHGGSLAAVLRLVRQRPGEDASDRGWFELAGRLGGGRVDETYGFAGENALLLFHRNRDTTARQTVIFCAYCLLSLGPNNQLSDR